MLPAARGRRAAIALALVAGSAVAAGRYGFGRGAAEADDDDAGSGRAPMPLPAGARVERDVPYGADPRQRLDAYVPAGATKAPIVVMVHGGGWMLGDKGAANVVAAKAARWLPRGAILVSVGYRLDRAAPQPLQQADDVAQALAAVQRLAPQWGGDPARLVLVGHSSGAHLVALLAADRRIAERAGVRPWLGTVALDSAAYDIVEIMERRHYPFYDRVFGADRRLWVDSSPQRRIDGRPAPVLLVCSSRRGESCGAADRFAAALQAAGSRASVLPVDLAHGAINAELGHDSAYTAQVEGFMKSVGLF